RVQPGGQPVQRSHRRGRTRVRSLRLRLRRLDGPAGAVAFRRRGHRTHGRGRRRRDPARRTRRASPAHRTVPRARAPRVLIMADSILTEKEALELLAYLATAAELTIIEPELYGSFRLVDAAGRLLGYLADRGSEATRDSYRALAADIDREKLLMMWDREAYVEFVRRLPGQLARELVQADEAPGAT